MRGVSGVSISGGLIRITPLGSTVPS
jgi:hypothetical protein